MDLSQIAIVTFLGALAAYAVKELIDALTNFFWPGRRSGGTLVDLDRELDRQMERERLIRRIHLYSEFTRHIDQAIGQLSLGTTRMNLIYAARDYYRDIAREAPKDIANAARQMCRICEEIMLSEYSETRYNRYQRAHKEFTDACLAETGQMPASGQADVTEIEAPPAEAARGLSPTE